MSVTLSGKTELEVPLTGKLLSGVTQLSWLLVPRSLLMGLLQLFVLFLLG